MKIEVVENVGGKAFDGDEILYKIYRAVRPQAEAISLKEALEWYENTELKPVRFGRLRYNELDLEQIEISLTQEEIDNVIRTYKSLKEAEAEEKFEEYEEQDYSIYEALKPAFYSWFQIARVYLTRLEHGEKHFHKYLLDRSVQEFEKRYLKEDLANGTKKEKEKA